MNTEHTALLVILLLAYGVGFLAIEMRELKKRVAKLENPTDIK